MTVRQATKGRTQERNARSSSSTRLLMSRSQSLSNALGSSSVAGTRPRSNRTGRGAGLVATSESGLAAASVVAVVAPSCARHLRIGRGVNNIGRMVCPPPGKLVWCLSRGGTSSVVVIVGREVVRRPKRCGSSCRHWKKCSQIAALVCLLHHSPDDPTLW